MPSGPRPGPTPVPGRFRPRLILQTLTRGDGLLGLRAVPGFGPRGAQVTVAQVLWTYETEGGLRWQAPAPTRLVAARPAPVLLRGAWDERVELVRDTAAEADARDALWDSGLRPLDDGALQWRSAEAAEGHESLWSLPEESRFGDFFAEQVPRLQAAGWQVVVRPGFAHESVPVQRWTMVIDEAGDEPGRAVAEFGERVPTLQALRQPHRQGSWRVSLGVEVEGETLDLVPLLADLLRRDARWLDARAIDAMPDEAIVGLRAPGGRRIDAPAGPLKAIVAAMVDLLDEADRRAGPLTLSAWDSHRLEALQAALADSASRRAGAAGAWAFQGEAGLAALAERLRRAGTPPPVEPPAGLGLTLRGYQREGLAWLQYLRAQGLAGVLADDMGLGKTAQVLAHLLVEKEAGRTDRPSLVVLPTSLIANWQAEAARIAPALRTLTLHGSGRHDAHDRVDGHDLVLTTYPLLWRDIDRLAARPWHLLVLDEAQTVKNATSRAAAAVRRIDARHRLCVTGTPVENHLGELWTHFDLLMPGFLGDARSFQRRWRRPIEGNGETLRAQLLARRVRPFILRRRKEDVAAELPPRTEVVRRVVLEGGQRALYESVRLAVDERVRSLLQRQGLARSQIEVLDALLKLRQVCCDPRLVQGPGSRAGSAKLDWLADALPALVDEGRRVLVFSQFTSMLALVGERLAALQLPFLELTGDTPSSRRWDVVRRFQSRQAEAVMLLSLKAGGVGLNLTAADTVILLDPWWNPAVERQAADRAHRIGQDRPVFVYSLVAEGSIEERMLALQARKAALAESVLGHDTEGAAKFGEDDLRGLLAPLETSRPS